MAKIDTKEWKEFRIGDLFVKAERGSVKSLQLLSPGNTPVIAAGAYNQGIAGFYDIKSEYKNQITISCNGAGCGSAFYHDYPFNINGDAIVLIAKDVIPESAKRFIACIINGVFTRKYSYEEKCSGPKALNETIKLPVTSENLPDYAYMEQYMRRLEDSVSSSLTALQSAQEQEKKKIDMSGWKKFRIGDLFIIKRPAARSWTNYNEGDTPFVASGNFNNGVLKYLKPKQGEMLDKGNCITVSPIDGSSFYQANDFLGRGGAGSSIILLYNPNLNPDNGLFIATSIRTICKKYEYGDMANKDTISAEEIYLPVTPDGNPDWECMEKYIKAIQSHAAKRLFSLAN